jgi:PQQ-like domain
MSSRAAGVDIARPSAPIRARYNPLGPVELQRPKLRGTDVVYGTSSVSPVLGEALYVGTNAGTMYALDPATGAIQWSTSVGAAISAPAAVADGTVFVPTADGRLVALDAATGGRSWTASTGVELGVQPAVAGGVVFTGSDDGALHAFAAAGCGSATCERLRSGHRLRPPLTGPVPHAGAQTCHPTVSHPSRAARVRRWRLSGSLVVRRAASW